MARTPLSAQASLDLWQSRSWGYQSHWLLVSAQGEEIGEGVGLPDGEKILALLRTKGLVPRWETRRTFLQRHPENGDAWQEAILMAGRLAEAWMGGLLAAGKAERSTLPMIGGDRPSIAFTETDPQVRERQADHVFGELAEALAGMRPLRGWWREPVDLSLSYTPAGLLAENPVPGTGSCVPVRGSAARILTFGAAGGTRSFCGKFTKNRATT